MANGGHALMVPNKYKYMGIIKRVRIVKMSQRQHETVFDMWTAKQSPSTKFIAMALTLILPLLMYLEEKQ